MLRGESVPCTRYVPVSAKFMLGAMLSSVVTGKFALPIVLDRGLLKQRHHVAAINGAAGSLSISPVSVVWWDPNRMIVEDSHQVIGTAGSRKFR